MKIIQWFFCKINRPIISPSLSCLHWFSEPCEDLPQVCVYCRKDHRHKEKTLINIVEITVEAWKTGVKLSGNKTKNTDDEK